MTPLACGSVPDMEDAATRLYLEVTEPGLLRVRIGGDDGMGRVCVLNRGCVAVLLYYLRGAYDRLAHGEGSDVV